MNAWARLRGCLRVSRTSAGTSFESRGDWIIGESTDNNSVTLTLGSDANFTFSLTAALTVTGAVTLDS